MAHKHGMHDTHTHTHTHAPHSSSPSDVVGSENGVQNLLWARASSEAWINITRIIKPDVESVLTSTVMRSLVRMNVPTVRNSSGLCAISAVAMFLAA